MADTTRIPPEGKQFLKPQINLVLSAAGRIWLVNLCAFLAIFQSSLSDSFSSLGVAAGALFAAVLTEFLFLYKSGKAASLKDGSAVATALILTLLLPNQISPVTAAAGAVFAIAVVKHSFGGLGSNCFNPAASGWLFIRLCWPASFDRALEASPLSLLAESVNRGVTNLQGSPLGILKVEAAGVFAASSLDSAVSSFFNRTIFSFAGAELPGGYIDLFISRFPGIIADRGMLALFLGTVIITAYRVNRSWIPALYLLVSGALFRFAGALPYGGGFWQGDVLFAFCSGGTLAAAFFLTADPATGAKSKGGIFFSVLLPAVLAFLFRIRGAEPYGAVFAVLSVNALLPLIRAFENRLLYERRKKPRSGTSEAGTSESRVSDTFSSPGINPGDAGRRYV